MAAEGGPRHENFTSKHENVTSQADRLGKAAGAGLILRRADGRLAESLANGRDRPATAPKGRSWENPG
jgi:hypothetical protein